jgi:transglutaminase-like putative cysteine protease
MLARTGLILMKTEKQQPVQEHVLIVSVLGVVIGPLLLNLPLWVAGWCLTFWGYALLADKKKWPWPNRTVRLILTCIGFMAVLVFLGEGVSLGGQIFIGLLSVMAGLKPLETKSHRDRVVTLFMAYFIIISSLFIIENLFITLYMFVSVLVTTACLVHFNLPERQLKTNLRLAAIIMIQAIPLMVLSFLLFPRAEGTFFALPGRFQGRTGFSESMQPGSISRLVREDRTAFRAQFQGDFPEAASLYWRGLVLWHFDGKSWTRGSVPARHQRRIRGQKVFQYDIVLEPHRKKHLFALDLPLSSPPLTRLTEDYTLMSLWPMRKVYRYKMRSSPDARIISMGAQEEIARQIPAHGNPEAKLLAAAWRSRLGSPEAVLDQAIQHFKQNEYSYTLKPMLLGENPVDEFLFGTKSGYCEHFASAFAYLMRAADIPARVVVGYLGGARNPYGNYLIIKQYHAHAWVEVFLDNQGWVRVDPTALVVPERVSMGLADSLLSEDLPDFLTQTGIGRLSSYLRKMTYMWDAINLQWNAWFMEYSRTEQMFLLVGFFSKIAWRQVGWIMGVGGLLAGLAVMGRIKYKRNTTAGDKDPVKKAYDLFCHKLERVGISREPAQGPVDFARMGGLIRSELKGSIERITHKYIALRYKSNQGKISHQSFLKMIRKFNPK